jgi:DNA invertase Pin-like site-specific DNA recombinase
MREDRPGLAEAIAYARKGDVLTVWKLDRLGRTMKSLIRFVDELGESGVEFKSLNEGLDTSTPMGRFTFHILGALA